ncbi:hypothetical protein OC842_005149 [Tilletia horrida]|uniref:Uncharacterized protein n=1 Tax=Tilletia horrida TaxID=155126 RepID=A0AAN6G8B0_9BASI|nr:hypothetical protein OC842_005149 [Tilletia horrida]
MPPPAYPPQTPTRALLNRIRRRSQVVPDSALPPPLPSNARASLDLHRRSTAAAGAAGENEEDDDEQSALERQVDALLEAGESKDKIITDLKKNNAELRAELKVQKQLVEELKLSNKKRLNEQTLSNLEQEFHQQENILQGLQRDNEEKTIEIERVKRKDKVLTEYLIKLHGEDWPSVVAAAVGGASVLPSCARDGTEGAPTAASAAGAGSGTGVGDASMSSSAVARVFASAMSSRSLNTSSLERSLSNPSGGGGGGSAHHKRASMSSSSALPLPPATPMKVEREAAHFSSSPSKMEGSNWGDTSFVSAVDTSTFQFPSQPAARGIGSSGSGHAADAAALGPVQEEDSKRLGDAEAHKRPMALSTAELGAADLGGTVTVQQLDIMRASIESTRLLVQGYLRADATRRTKLDQMLEVAERRTREFEGVVSAH